MWTVRADAGGTDRGVMVRRSLTPPGGVDPAGEAWTIVGRLFAGIVVWGGIGVLLDRVFGFSALFLPIGVVLGLGGALYLTIVRLRQ